MWGIGNSLIGAHLLNASLAVCVIYEKQDF